MSRVILTFATGAPAYHEMAKGLAFSLHLQGSVTPRAVLTDRPDDPEFAQLFTHVVRPPAGFDHWFMKLSAFEALDVEEVLFLDGDGLAIRNADQIFDHFTECDFGVQGRWETHPGHWYGDIESVMVREGVAQIPRFSGGFLYYRRTDATRRLFEEIFRIRDRYDELGLERNGGHVVDEVCIALAMAKTGVGTVLPDSANLSVTPWRRVGGIELDVVGGRCRFLRQVEGIEVAEPIIYHTAMARWDLKYWRELRRMLKLFRQSGPPDEFRTDFWSQAGKKFRRLLVEVYRRLWLRL
jgi:hypothetical protein